MEKFLIPGKICEKEIIGLYLSYNYFYLNINTGNVYSALNIATYARYGLESEVVSSLTSLKFEV